MRYDHIDIPIVVLDIDGPIINELRGKPNKRAVRNLNFILEKTKAKIVICSAWSIIHFAQNIYKANEYLTEWGVNNPDVIGFTGSGSGFTPRSAEFNPREEEILRWVENTRATNWCSIDDSVMDRERMVRVKSLCGIYMKHALKVIEWLGER